MATAMATDTVDAALTASIPPIHNANTVVTFELYGEQTALDPQMLATHGGVGSYEEQQFRTAKISATTTPFVDEDGDAHGDRYLTVKFLGYASGRVVVTGARSLADAPAAGWKLAAYMSRICGDIMRIRNFRAHNRVACTEVNGFIDLNALARRFPLQVSYDAWRFPGAIFRDDKFGPPLVLFSSGRVIIPGGTTAANLEEHWTRFYTMYLRPFIVNTRPSRRPTDATRSQDERDAVEQLIAQIGAPGSDCADSRLFAHCTR
jgi:hypothetical protein